MGNEKSLGEKVGNILQRIADKEELLSYLHLQPLSREWEQEDILNCKPEYMAVLTENEREVRNVFEQTLQRQADRLIHLDNVTNRELSTIEAEDIAPAQPA